MIPTNPYDPNQYNQPTITGQDIATAWDILRKAGIELTGNKNQFSGNVPPNPPQYEAPTAMLETKTSEPTPVPEVKETPQVSQPSQGGIQSGAQQVQSPVNEQETPAELQPGNRKSMKDYLNDVRKLREQQIAQGVPEDQLIVPTFTNVQGGSLDKSQGYLETGPGGMGAQEVRSYVNPEYVQGAGGASDISRGPAHPITRGMALFGKNIPRTNNRFRPEYSMGKAADIAEDVYNAGRKKYGKDPTPQQFAADMNTVRNAILVQQGKEISDYKKKFGKDITVKQLIKAFDTGDFSVLDKAGKQDYFSEEKLMQIKEDARAIWQKSISNPNNPSVPLNPDTQEPFKSPEEFSQYSVNHYIEMTQELLDALHEFKSQKSGAGKNGQAGPAKGAKVVNTGVLPDGRKVKQYDDGTIFDENGNKVK